MATAPHFPRAAITACLDRICASRHFSRSQRLRRFLRFTVQALLEGRAGEIKERTVGTEVYGRPLEYDPRADPIVRSEAHRLRGRLAAYYEGEGAADPIVVAYPKGSYVPSLRSNPKGPPLGAEPRRLLVTAFRYVGDEGPPRAESSAMDEMQRVLHAHLEAWPGLEVRRPAPPALADGVAEEHLIADYRVDGRFEPQGGHCAVRVRLLRAADGAEVWSGTERISRTGAGGGSGERAASAAGRRLASAIGSSLTRRAGPRSGVASRAYEAYVKGRHSAILYSNVLDPRHLASAQRRLESAIAQEPGYVDALAELAHLELLRLYPPVGDPADCLARARALLERALANEPGHARSLYLLGHLEGSTLRPREALRLTETAVACDPEDAEGRTMLAVRYATLGFWESAVVACDWALALDPVWDAPHRIKVYLLCRMGRPAAARRAIAGLERAGSSPFELAIAGFDVRMAEGDVGGARAAVECLVRNPSLRPDEEERRELAWALARALQGAQREARPVLDVHRGDGPRFWDHTIRLALALGEEELACELLLANPINRSYRWLACDALLRPSLQRAPWRAVVEDLHAGWRRDLEEVGPRLPVSPPLLPGPADLPGRDRRPEVRPLSSQAL